MIDKGIPTTGLLAQVPVAEEVLQFYAAIYDIEWNAQLLDFDQRTLKTKPIMDMFHMWLVLQRQKATDGTAIAKAIDYSLNCWDALVRFVEDGSLPPDNNHIENRIRPIALGRSNWLFAGSLHGGQRAAAVMSLIEELLPHRFAASLNVE